MPEPTGLSCIMDQRRDFNAWLRDFIAVTLGLTVPAMVSGRAVLQGLAAAALIATLILAARDRGIFARAGEAVRTRFGIVVLIAFGCMAISIPGSLDPLRSLDAWARTLAYMGGCVLFWAFLVNDARARRLALLSFLIVLAVGVVLVVCAQYSTQYPLRFVRNESFMLPKYTFASNYGFAEPKAFAAAASCSLPLLALIAWQDRSRWRWVAGATVVGLLWIIVSVSNKSAVAGILGAVLAASLVLAVGAGRRKISIWILAAGAIVWGGLAMVYNMPDEPPSTAVWDWIPPQIIDTHRQQIWRFTAEKIAEAPWTGHGINVIDQVAGADRIVRGYNASVLPSHPHNWVLEVLVETGVIGFGGILLALGWLMMQAALRVLRNGTPEALAQVALSGIFWVSSLFNFSIWSSWWLITFFLLWTLLAAGPATCGSKPSNAP